MGGRLRSRRLEVVGEREKRRATETREGCRVSPSRVPVFSRAHYFQGPATLAMWDASRKEKKEAGSHLHKAPFLSLHLLVQHKLSSGTIPPGSHSSPSSNL